MKLLTHAEQRIIQEALADRREMGESNQPDDAKIAALCDTLEAAEGLVEELANRVCVAQFSTDGFDINDCDKCPPCRARAYLEARGNK